MIHRIKPHLLLAAGGQKSGKIYVLNGTRLMQEPVKGVFIKNDKKCIG